MKRPKLSTSCCRALIFASALGLAACSATPTPYQVLGDNGGYSDQRIESDRFSVTFQGNSATPRDVVEEYALFRAAEVTLENGYDHFKVVSREIEPVAESYRGGGPRIGLGVGRGIGNFGFGVSTGFGGGGRAEYAYAGYLDIVVIDGEKPGDDRDVYTALDVIENLKGKVNASAATGS